MTKTPAELATEYVEGLESQQPGCYNQSYGTGALEEAFLAGIKRLRLTGLCELST